MNECLFCKIIRGELPSTKVYEDDRLFAILDINPVNIGHTLIVPKLHFDNVLDADDAVLADIVRGAKRVAVAIKAALRADGINLEMNNERSAGQLVPHIHLHVIPRFEGDGFLHWRGKRGYVAGEADDTAKKIASAIQ